MPPHSPPEYPSARPREVRASAAFALASAMLLAARSASGSSAIEYPDNGVAQFSRGGAWLATASDPIAGYYNPAAIVTQPTSVGLGFNVVFQKICFQRRGPGDTDTSYDVIGPSYGEVCNENAGRPNAVPNFAFVWRAAEELALALTVTPPASFGKLAWPDQITVTNQGGFPQPIPAPQRYLSMGVDGTILLPTLSAAYAVDESLRFGIGFVWGIAILELSSNSMGNVQPGQTGDQAGADTKSTLDVKDLFVPGVVVGAHYSATKNVDVAGWYRFSDAIKAQGNLTVLAPYYTNSGQVRAVCQPGQLSQLENCAETTHSEDQVGDDGAKVKITVPMEARLGIRWHMPHRNAPGTLLAEKLRQDTLSVRDPLRDDLYDLELDVTWANNSAAKAIEIRFPAAIAVNGSPGGQVPQNADRPTNWADSFGARLGGQYALLRNKLGVRLGTWVETSVVGAKSLNVTGVPALRGGLGGGLVLRVQRVDLELGYQRLWNAGLDNHGEGELKAIAGSSSAGGSFDYRSFHAVNGGRVTQSANIFALGGVARF